MNAKQRRRERRHVQDLEERLEIAELRARVAEADLKLSRLEVDALVAERDRVAWDAADTQTKLARARAELEEARADVARSGSDCQMWRHHAEQRAGELAQLRAEEHDSAKLRRRLEVRRIELDNAHERIRELEAQVRALTPPAPMIDLHRRPAS